MTPPYFENYVISAYFRTVFKRKHYFLSSPRPKIPNTNPRELSIKS